MTKGKLDRREFGKLLGAAGVGSGLDPAGASAGLGFVHGASITCGNTGARPIAYRPTPPGTPRWGSRWKRAVAKYYNRTMCIGAQAACLSYRQHYLDLDPHYEDALGQPCLRMTFDWGPSERKATAYLAEVCERIGRVLSPTHLSAGAGAAAPDSHYSIVPYQSTHNTGGAIMGADPSTSAVNRYLQSWDVPNVFVVGASAFPQNAGYNPTGTVGALAYWTADALVNRYRESPGPLV